MLIVGIFALAVVSRTPVTPNVDADYKRLAAAGNRQAMVVAAEAAVRGGEFGEAFRWFSAAAELGDTTAQVRLADLYVDGRGVIRDAAKAAHWYAMAVGRSAEAQWKLGALFQEGDGVKQSPEIAAAMYRRAADQGYADAQNSLASLYIAGVGVKQDLAEAMKLFRLAATHDCADAQINLAGLYYHGIGVKQDFDEARRWAIMSRKGRPKEAAELLDKIEKARAGARASSRSNE